MAGLDERTSQKTNEKRKALQKERICYEKMNKKLKSTCNRPFDVVLYSGTIVQICVDAGGGCPWPSTFGPLRQEISAEYVRFETGRQI